MLIGRTKWIRNLQITVTWIGTSFSNLISHYSWFDTNLWSLARSWTSCSFKIHIVVESSVSDWASAAKNHLRKYILQDEVYKWVPLLSPLICVWNLVPIKSQKICLLHSQIWGDLISQLEVLIFFWDIHSFYIECLGKICQGLKCIKFSSVPLCITDFLRPEVVSNLKYYGFPEFGNYSNQ